MSVILDTSAQSLKDFQWENRIILIFGDKENDQLVDKQRTILEAAKSELKERDLVIFVNPASKSMSKLRNETGFEVILIGKDGGVKKRKTELMTTEELFGIIDSMPMRQSEMRKQR